ncbi:UNVERIFIED_CONTAM: movement protein [Sesamum radiatum]|uniref:Movement protein n=1 Tax=Sesamum radiatum TaxID=300843 RepID=A0AAW2VNS9_SESRA
MFFAKICSPWREMLIQSYKVPEGQLDSVARRMSFLKDKLKDWCYQASIQKNMKRLRGTINELLSVVITMIFNYYRRINLLWRFGTYLPIRRYSSDESVYEEEIETDSDGSSTDQRVTTTREIASNILKPVRILFQNDGIKQNHGKNHASRLQPQPIRWIAYNLADQDFSRVLTLHQDFKRKDLMKEGNRPYSITYRIAYALSNTHHSDLFLRKEYIEIPKIFKEFAKQPVIDRYEGMLEIAGHEILVAGIAGREHGSMTLGLNFLENHKPWGRKAKPGVFPKEAMETLPVIAGRDFSQKILILNKGIREAKIMIGGAFGHPGLGQQGLIDSDSFYKESEEKIKNLKEALQEIKLLDISEESKLSLENVKRLIQRNFSENPLAWWERNKIEATLKVKEE